MPCAGAHDRIRTGDLFLTKEVLYRLSYMGPLTPSIHSLSQPRLSWSGKRDSNPRPSAWKADALPTELFPPWILVRSPLHASWWRGKDSNLRRHKPADLQSAPFVHSGTSPRCQHGSTDFRKHPVDSADRPLPPALPWSWRRDLNPRPAVYKTAALPLSYASRLDKRQMLTGGSRPFKASDRNFRLFRSSSLSHDLVKNGPDRHRNVQRFDPARQGK